MEDWTMVFLRSESLKLLKTSCCICLGVVLCCDWFYSSLLSLLEEYSILMEIKVYLKLLVEYFFPFLRFLTDINLKGTSEVY